MRLPSATLVPEFSDPDRDFALWLMSPALPPTALGMIKAEGKVMRLSPADISLAENGAIAVAIVPDQEEAGNPAPSHILAASSVTVTDP